MRISDWSSDVCSSDLLGLDVFTDDALQDVHTIVLSPGLSPLQEPIKSFLALAAARQIQVVGEIELFARALADMSEKGYQPKLLAVTGTNGKTTVKAMTRPVLQACGLSARAAGNISTAALAALSAGGDADGPTQVGVVELS